MSATGCRGGWRAIPQPNGLMNAFLHEHKIETAELMSLAERLADELELLTAVSEIATIDHETMAGTLTAIAAHARASLSAEFAAVGTIPSADADWAFGSSAGGWEPADPEVAARALRSFGADPSGLPLLADGLGQLNGAPEGFADADGVAAVHVLPIGSPPVAVMLTAHTDAATRGSGTRHDRLAHGMADVAELVIRRAIAKDRLRDENARLAELLRTDALTGVASRSAWDDALRALEQRRGEEPLSVVVVDVDELKIVNDEAGHAAGDALLRHCARLLAEAARSGDLVARIGGDEFGVLLRATDERQAAEWCAALDRLETKCWSIGWASVPPADSLPDAIARADRHMYGRKLARRVARP